MKEVSVLIEGTQHPFSGRLIGALSEVGVDAWGFPLPKDRKWRTVLNYMLFLLRLPVNNARIVHYIGGHHPFPIYLTAWLAGKKVVIHWIGTDSYDLSRNGASRLRMWRLRKAHLHLAQADHIVEELKVVSINAKVIPLVPSRILVETPPLGDSILVYLKTDDKGDKELYGFEETMKLAKEMPDVKFLIIGRGSLGNSIPSNINPLGWLDTHGMDDVWAKTKVYLRLTKHDGLPLTLLEALARGRYVVWTQEFPFCTCVTSVEGAKVALRELLSKESLNSGGVSHVRENFDPLKIAEKIKVEYMKLLSNGLAIFAFLPSVLVGVD
jgi:hypothetical protein